MPRYFIDTDDGEQHVQDEEGFELADAAAARREATTSLSEMAYDMTPDGDQRTFSALVRDATGRAIYSAVLSFEGREIDGPSES